ncbi:Putative flippase GtrA (transmembrane translocase of bactoprenol-linked glucose) [Actinopolyspora lacussalsi subsp. righensis]|uniref:Putative flippase GtrA (Transmembrane translocase of bactoprenol-linked glucose) n=1 Tax=Actinopolyspora righensis TaxID=995060 RepID=A0A1I6YEK8_9ACTN|nr:GtrA family protein [Actinopolyspora righensis]SFT48955.1 Putative flippase GtrA (transmembrane translocase of bactoprenol-linked glucose) [Actinopolyspora righensis]
MSVVDEVLTQLPRPLRQLALRYRELLKFAMVGASTFVIDTVIFFALKWTVLAPKPVTAKVVAVLVATIVSYVLNREWAFRTRGGKERHHEASLYFLFSGIAIGLYAAPLWVSRYLLHLQTPYTTPLVEEIADFTSGQILGVLLGMAFRWWAFRRWVFPTRETETTECPTQDVTELSNVEPFPIERTNVERTTIERAAGERATADHSTGEHGATPSGASHGSAEEHDISRPAAG